MKRKIVVAVGTMIAVFGLVSCGSEFSESGNSGESTEPATGVEVQKVDGLDSNTFYVVDKEVEEGKSVTCVVYEHRDGRAGQGGLSCNWDEYNEKHDLSETAE